MEIHELNTKAITNPAYIAADDGSDTYKMDLNAMMNAVDAAIAQNTSDISALWNRSAIVYYGECDTAANTQRKIVTGTGFTGASDVYIAIKFKNGSTTSKMTLRLETFDTRYLLFNGSNNAPNLAPNSILLFRIVEVTDLELTPQYEYSYVGYYSTDGGGGGGTSDYTDLSNKPQINGVTLEGDISSSDLGIGRNWTYLPHRTNPAVDAHNSYSMINRMELGTASTLRHNMMLEALGANTGDYIATWTESTGSKDYADSSGQTSVYAMLYVDKWGNRNVKTDAVIQTSAVVDVFPHNDTVYDENGDALCTIVAASDSTVKRRSNDYIFIGTVYGSDGKYHIVYRTATTNNTPAIVPGASINVLEIGGAEWDMTTLREDYAQKTSQLNTYIVYRSNYYYMAVVQNGVGIAIMRSSDCIDWELLHHIPDTDAHLEACMCVTEWVSNQMATVFVAVRHNYGDGFITLFGYKGLGFDTTPTKTYIPASTGRPMMVSDNNAKNAYLCFSVNGRRNAVVLRIGSNNDGNTAYELITTPLDVMSNYPCMARNNKMIVFGGTNGLGSGKKGVSICPIWSEDLTNYDDMSENLADVAINGAFVPGFTSADDGKFLTIDSNGDIVATAMSAWTGGSY